MRLNGRMFGYTDGCLRTGEPVSDNQPVDEPDDGDDTGLHPPANLVHIYEMRAYAKAVEAKKTEQR